MNGNLDDFFKVDSSKVLNEIIQMDAEVLVLAGKLAQSLEQKVWKYGDELSFEVKKSYEKFQRQAKDVFNYWYSYKMKKNQEIITLSDYLSNLRNKINNLAASVYELEQSIYDSYKKQKHPAYEELLSSIHSSIHWEYFAKKNMRYLEKIKEEIINFYLKNHNRNLR